MTEITRLEYQKVRGNLLSILNRARRDGIQVDDLRGKVPDVPKKITEASVRRIKKIHGEVKHEVAKRRRLNRRYKTPEYVPDIALENLRDMINEAIEDPQGALRRWLQDNYRGPHAYPNWEICIRASGRAADILLDSAVALAKSEAAKMKPKPEARGTMTRAEWNEAKARSIIRDRAEEVIRTARETMEHFLYGYQMPSDAPKPELYAVVRAILGNPMTKAEIQDLVTPDDMDWGFDYYE